MSEQRTLYLDQFTDATITNSTAAQDGVLSRLTSFGIAIHMGNQLGVLTRISATLACLGVLTSVLTGLLMWWKRRPAGHTGLPGPASAAARAATPRRAKITVSIAAVVLGVLYPVFGLSLLVVLAVEAVLARRRTPDAPAEVMAAALVEEDAALAEALADAEGEGDVDDAPVVALQ